MSQGCSTGCSAVVAHQHFPQLHSCGVGITIVKHGKSMQGHWRRGGVLRNVDFVYQHQGVTLVRHLMVLFGMLGKCVDALKLNVHIPQVSESCMLFCKNDVNNAVKLKIRHNYYYQIQGQLAILNLEWCDFVVLTSTDYMLSE